MANASVYTPLDIPPYEDRLDTAVISLLELQSRFGDTPLKIQVVCPQNGTAVLKGKIATTKKRSKDLLAVFRARYATRVTRIPGLMGIRRQHVHRERATDCCLLRAVFDHTSM